MADTARLRAAAALMRSDAPHWHPVAAWLDTTAAEADRHAAAGWGNCETEVTQPYPLAVADAYLARARTPASGPVRAAVRDLVAAVRAVPVDCTALTGPVWYGAGWNDATDHMQEIADAWPADDTTPAGADVDAIRARHAEWAATVRDALDLADDPEFSSYSNDVSRVADGRADRIARDDVPKLLALVDELTARLSRSVSARDLLDVVAQRRTALVRLAAAEARIAELEAQTATADVDAHPSEDAYLVEQQDPLLLDEPDGGWGPATSVQPNEAVMRDLMRVNRERVPGRPPMRVVRRRLSWTVVATEDTPSGETAPGSPQNAMAHPETRETGGSAA